MKINSFLTSGPVEGESISCSGHFILGWVSETLWWRQKLLPPSGIEPWTSSHLIHWDDLARVTAVHTSFVCNDRVLKRIIATISVTWILDTALFLQAGIKRCYHRVTGCPFYCFPKHAWQVSQSWETKTFHGQGHEKRDTLYNYVLSNS